jgi:hypothetical protein
MTSNSFNLKTMSRKDKILVLLILSSILELLYLKPLSPSYYIFNFWGKLVVILGIYGFPLYLILPISLILLLVLLIRGKWINIWTTLFRNAKQVYLLIIIIFLFFNTILVLSKAVLNKDPFPLIKYSSINGTQDNIDDIKVGTFRVKGGILTRDDKTEKSISLRTNDTIITDLKWISANEYEVKSRKKNIWRLDNTTRIIITSNKSDFYECYVKFGEYAKYYKFFK